MPQPPQIPQQFQFDIAKMTADNPLNITPQYANNTYCQATDWALRLVFTEMIPTLPSGIRAELRANVVMTPAQAKALAASLKAVIEQYEARLGTIQWPPKTPSQL